MRFGANIMSLLPLRNAGKWVILGIAFTAIVTATAPGMGDGAAKTAHSAESPQPHAASAPPARAKQRVVGPVHVELERLAQRQSAPKPAAEPEVEIGNVFGATSWYVPPPPPPPPPPAPPPEPTAPPLPFTYLGRYEDAPTQLVILVKGDRMFIVAEGDVIEDTYRIERLTPDMVELTYLPLDIRQSLSTGETL